MNCAQHPESAVVAYCQTCGKALCESCKRDVQGSIFCEPCLAARLRPGNFGGAYPPPPGVPHPPEHASPGLALALGFIPGVGAFYNGQYLKGFVHVLVFSTLIWLSDHGFGDVAGLFIAAWLFYMVFDAWATAKARRNGQPLPDPLGLNRMLDSREGNFRQSVEQVGERVGNAAENAAQQWGQKWQQAGGVRPGAAPGQAADAAQGAAGQSVPPPGAAAGPNPGTTAYVGPQGTYYSGPEGTYYVAPEPPREHSPVGAVVLIGLGFLFLLANLGWFSFHWVLRFWPLILVVLGVWLFAKRQHDAR